MFTGRASTGSERFPFRVVGDFLCAKSGPDHRSCRFFLLLSSGDACDDVYDEDGDDGVSFARLSVADPLLSMLTAVKGNQGPC